MLEYAYQYSYFYAHWDTIRKAAHPWIEAWYFLEAGKHARLQHYQALALKARADFRKQLQAYERLKKNAILFSAALLRFSQSDAGPLVSARQEDFNSKTDNIQSTQKAQGGHNFHTAQKTQKAQKNTPAAQDALVSVNLPVMQLCQVNVHANVSTQTFCY